MIERPFSCSRPATGRDWLFTVARKHPNRFEAGPSRCLERASKRREVRSRERNSSAWSAIPTFGSCDRGATDRVAVAETPLHYDSLVDRSRCLREYVDQLGKEPTLDLAVV
jgi:hypothetical protein